jgi:hypothetical protein
MTITFIIWKQTALKELDFLILTMLKYAKLILDFFFYKSETILNYR